MTHIYRERESWFIVSFFEYNNCFFWPWNQNMYYKYPFVYDVAELKLTSSHKSASKYPFLNSFFPLLLKKVSNFFLSPCHVLFVFQGIMDLFIDLLRYIIIFFWGKRIVSYIYISCFHTLTNVIKTHEFGGFVDKIDFISIVLKQT